MWSKPIKCCVIGAIVWASGAALAIPVGTVAGAVSVSPTGQASYGIPIKVPVGTNGLAPTLSVNYSSSKVRGLLGPGWNLGGVSVIARCSKQKTIDGAFDTNVALDKTDRLCLDGVRLISGDLDATTVYRTEMQGFAKIAATVQATPGQPNMITVTTSDGLVMTYGRSANAKVTLTSRTDGTVLAWLLSDVTDRFGNSMYYTYTQDATNTSYVLQRIAYAENPSTSPAIAALHKVEFDYIVDNTVPYGYIGDSRMRNNRLLSVIRIETLRAGSYQQVRRYEFGYRTDAAGVAKPSLLTKRPVLTRVTQCDNGECLKPTTFTWADGKLNFDQVYIGPVWSDAAGWNSLQAATTIRYIDLNADGKTDICGRTSTGVQCYLSTGSSFSATVIDGPAWSDAAGWNQEPKYSTIQFADINGDGRADICGRDTTGIVCYKSLGGSFDLTNPVSLTSDFTDALGWGADTTKYYYTIQFVDLDGDGRSDVCGIGSEGLKCYYSQSSGFATAPLYTEATWNSTNVDITSVVPTLTVMDIDNNRSMDICVRGMSTDSQNLFRCKMVKPVLGAAIVNNYDQSSLGALLGKHFRFVDVNNDGFVDQCLGSQNFYLCIKNRRGAVSTEGLVARLIGIEDEPHLWEWLVGYLPFTAGATTLTNSSFLQKNYASLKYMDINGDGLPDVCENSSDGFRCLLQERWPSYDVCYNIWLITEPENRTFDGNNCALSSPARAMSVEPPVPFATDDGYFDVFITRIDGPAWTDAAGFSNEHQYRTIGMADINGDGYPEVCGRETSGIKCYGTTTTPNDLISTITDGFGNQTVITYKRLTDSSVYTKGASAIYPDIDLAPPMPVVASLQSSNGRGGFSQINYSYGGLVVHVDRGFQGFAWRETRDQQTNKLQRISFRQAFPFTARVSQVEDRYCATPTTPTESCTLLHRTKTEWSQQDALPSPYNGIYPYASQSTEESWELPTTP